MRPNRTRTISFAEFDASVRGWINHMRYADGARSAARLSLDPDYRDGGVGLRVLCASPIE
jgi:hypothetical protein